MTTRQRTAAGGIPVAIVGIGCRFPGGIRDPASFWQLLIDGMDAIGEIPSNRIDIGRYFDPNPAMPGRMMSQWGGYLDHIESFDADFFGISPREAQFVDPQQRVLLETAYEALEDAGQNVRALEGSRSGVFVGQWTSDFESRLFADPEGVDFAMTIGSGRYASSGRLSYAFGFRGPSLTIDCACSSSLASVHLAVQSLRSGESELALAGGVNIILQPQITIGYSQSRMMASDGRCKFGDVSGDGYVRSEGAGLVVLKPLAQAMRDGDRVYAVIRGSAVNNDGRSSGVLGRPSRTGHEEMLQAAYRDAGIAPARVGYVEAHGTGTRAGDPVELAALGAVLGPDRPAEAACLVGSVKTNIGHTEGAAGIAGLIKASLALHHGAIPPSLHFVNPNPSVPWNALPMRIPTKMVQWPPIDGLRVAGVNSFGISGTNAHVALEEAPIPEVAGAAAPEGIEGGPALLAISAKSDAALRELASRYADMLESDAAPALHDVCWSASTRRTALEQRATFVAGDRASMVDALRRFREGDAPSSQGAVYGSARPRTAFVFPGQGGQWLGMGVELLAREPVFREALRRCDEAARPHIDWSILQQLGTKPGDPQYRMDQIDVIQPVLVSMAIAYAALWRSLGIEPDVVIGHSMGEVGAAHVAGVLDLPQAMRIICRRSALMRRASGQGAMALVELPWPALQARLAGRDGSVCAAVSNSPRSSVVSGDPAGVKAFLADMEREGIFCRAVNVDVASHSPQMDMIAAALDAELAGLEPLASGIPLYSTVFARIGQADEYGPAYWAANLRRPVRFGETVASLIADGVSTFIELGPHPVLLPSIEQTAQSLEKEARTISCGRRDESDRAILLASVGELWSTGCPIDWRAVWRNGGRIVGLPLYAWQRERHWAKAAERRSPGTDFRPASARGDVEKPDWLYRLAWQPSALSAIPVPRGDTPGSWLVLHEPGTCAAEVVAAMHAAGAPAELAPLCALESVPEDRWDSAGSLPGNLVLLTAEHQDAAYLPVRAVQALLGSPVGSRLPRLWFVTTGAQFVPGDGEARPGARVSADQAALWGSARVVAQEHPELWGGLVDLDPHGVAERSASLLARHLLAADGEDQVALRGNHRMVLRLARDDGSVAPCQWRSDSTYLVTGGLGEIGLQVARRMAQGGARRLILLGRTALPPRDRWSQEPAGTVTGRRIAAIRALEAGGVAVHTAAVDVGDESQLRSFLERYEAEAWPRIRGVVHAAGSLENHLVGSMTRSQFDAVLRPKLRGAQLLDKLLPDLDVFVMFSSIGAFLAQPGQANYAAANAGLDALAFDRHLRGLPAVSIGWGVWEGTGLVDSASGQGNVAELARQGIQAFPPAQGLTFFDGLSGRSDPLVAVLPIDWSVFGASRSGRVQPLYRDLAGGGRVDESGGVRERVRAAGPAERRLILQDLVRDVVGKVLKVAPSRIDPRKAMGDMGLSSLMAMELRNRLESALGRPLSATLAWNYPTVEALSDYLADADPATPSRSAQQPAAAGPPADDLSDQFSAVSVLSNEDAMLALRAGKKRKSR